MSFFLHLFELVGLILEGCRSNGLDLLLFFFSLLLLISCFHCIATLTAQGSEDGNHFSFPQVAGGSLESLPEMRLTDCDTTLAH